MIAYLSGEILTKLERCLVLRVYGTGYLVHATRGLTEQSNIGDTLDLFVHTHVREDTLALYGFRTEEEWRFFEQLLSVSGVGPKSALEILNAPMAHVKQAIAKKDAAFLTRIPGIGKKTAERIIVDLQEKMKVILMEADVAVSNDAHQSDELIQALVSLGYHRQQVIQGLKKIPREITDEEAQIKYFLQHA